MSQTIIIALAAAFLCVGGPARAQSTGQPVAPSGAPCGRDSVAQSRGGDSLRPASPGVQANDAAPVAITIFAEASAREVRFNSQPRLHVRLCGALDSMHVVDRQNLPTPVVAGTTYRDVHVAVEIFGRVNADCITRTVTEGARLDCASLEFRGLAPSVGTRDSTRIKPPRG